VDLSFAVFILILCGLLAGVIAQRKQHSFGAFFVLGFLLGVFGILWAILMRPGAPAGMRSGYLPPMQRAPEYSAV
jgi:hypothetical protein